jgi:hypothetical protein
VAARTAAASRAQESRVPPSLPSCCDPERAGARAGAAEDAEDAAGDRWEVFEKIFSESGRTRTPDCCC